MAKAKKTEVVIRDGVRWLARKKPGRPREHGENYDLLKRLDDEEPAPEKPAKPAKQDEQYPDGIARFGFGHRYLNTGTTVYKHCVKCDKRNHPSRTLSGECIWCGHSIKDLSLEELKAL